MLRRRQISPMDREIIDKLIRKREEEIRRYELTGRKKEASNVILRLIVELNHIYQIERKRNPPVAEYVFPKLNEWLERLHDNMKYVDTPAAISLKENEARRESWRVVKPSRCLEDIVGMDDTIEWLLGHILTALEHGPGSESPLPGYDDVHSNLCNFLFSGPPGTGKTHVAEGIAHKIGELGWKVNFIPVTGADIKNSNYGESEKRMLSLLEFAEELEGVSVVFIDEFEEIATRDRHEATASITNAILTKTSGVNAVKNVILIGATNRPWEIDKAIKDRFVTVEFSLPDAHTRFKIIEKKLEGYDNDKVKVDMQNIRLMRKQIAELTEGFSGRELLKAIRNASRHAYMEAKKNGGKIRIRSEHLKKGIMEVRRKIETNAVFVENYPQRFDIF